MENCLQEAGQISGLNINAYGDQSLNEPSCYGESSASCHHKDHQQVLRAQGQWQVAPRY